MVDSRAIWEWQHAGLAVALSNEGRSVLTVPHNPAKARIKCDKAMANWGVPLISNMNCRKPSSKQRTIGATGCSALGFGSSVGRISRLGGWSFHPPDGG